MPICLDYEFIVIIPSEQPFYAYFYFCKITNDYVLHYLQLDCAHLSRCFKNKIILSQNFFLSEKKKKTY